MSILYILAIIVLICIVAGLWYGVRTHKTVAELRAKLDAEVAKIKAKL